MQHTFRKWPIAKRIWGENLSIFASTQRWIEISTRCRTRTVFLSFFLHMSVFHVRLLSLPSNRSHRYIGIYAMYTQTHFQIVTSWRRRWKRKGKMYNWIIGNLYLVRTHTTTHSHMHKHSHIHTHTLTRRDVKRTIFSIQKMWMFWNKFIFLLLITLFIQGKSSIHWCFYIFTAEFSICCESQCISLNCSSFQHLYLFIVHNVAHRFLVHFYFSSLFFFIFSMRIHLFWFRSLVLIYIFTYSTSNTLCRTISARISASPLCL